MTCAKKQVRCEIWAGAFDSFKGTNDVQNAQDVCPREKGEGYEKCKTICNQPAHAELIALQKAKDAGADLTNAEIYIWGIDHCCKNCQRQLYAAGVRTIRFVK